MFRGFNITNCGEEKFGKNFDAYEKIGRNLCAAYKAAAAQSLTKFVIGNGNVLDGSAIQKHWFPTYEDKFDIFISHSHNDESLAYALAGWLNHNMKLNCFVDGEIWLSADGLIRQLDDLCQPKADSYDYQKRNLSTSQIHVMLSVAIMQMIDNCEVLFFLNTPNSIPIKQSINDLSLSPWLFLEIGISKIIQKNRNNVRLQRFSKIVNESQDIGYKMDLSHLTDLSVSDICKWKESFFDQKKAFEMDEKITGKKFKLDPLDVLYGLFPLPAKGPLFNVV